MDGKKTDTGVTQADREIELTVVGQRCVYLNDYRIAGGKPYVSENLPQHTFKLRMSDILSAIPELARHRQAAIAQHDGDEKPVAFRPMSDTAWLDGRDVVLSAHGMIVSARYCAGEWSDDTPINPREYNGAVWSCFDDEFQFEIEETGRGPSEWCHGPVVGWADTRLASTPAAPAQEDAIARADHARTIYARALEKMRIALLNVTDNLEDEGDRVYLGSTNHADDLKAAWQLADALQWDQVMEDTQPKTELAVVNLKLKENIAVLEAENKRLREALERIALMSKEGLCGAPDKRGYVIRALRSTEAPAQEGE